MWLKPRGRRGLRRPSMFLRRRFFLVLSGLHFRPQFFFSQITSSHQTMSTNTHTHICDGRERHKTRVAVNNSQGNRYAENETTHTCSGAAVSLYQPLATPFLRCGFICTAGEMKVRALHGRRKKKLRTQEKRVCVCFCGVFFSIQSHETCVYLSTALRVMHEARGSKQTPHALSASTWDGTTHRGQDKPPPTLETRCRSAGAQRVCSHAKKRTQKPQQSV